MALQLVRDIKEVRYFDIDSKAMDKFEKNMINKHFKLVRCKDAKEATTSADIITVCTASKAHAGVIKNDWVKAGVHINGVGGDSLGKTELELNTLLRSRIAVEYMEQSLSEGEIQRLGKNKARKLVELHELVCSLERGRENDEEITLFDSVGIALEDYSALRLTYELAEKYNIGEELNMIPKLQDPKDLISTLSYV